MARYGALAVLAVVPLVAGGVHGLGARWHARSLSAAGGVAIAYVFVHLLPELSTAQADVEGSGLIPYLEHHVYVFALFGLVAAFGNQRFALAHEAERAVVAIGVASIGAFLVGYSLASRDDAAIQPIVLFTVALGLHYLVVDHGIASRYPHAYGRVGRYVVSGSVLAGGAMTILVELSPAALALMLALIAGAVILETFRHELPQAGSINFVAFVSSAAVYTALLLALGQ